MRVLIVDDDTDVATFIGLILKDEGIASDIVEYGDDAITAASHGEHDVILLDYILSDMPGYEVLRALRQRDVQTPVVMMSGHANIREVIESNGLRAEEYLSKPFKTDTLLDCILSVHDTRHQPIPSHEERAPASLVQ
jgi:two-component system, cell cycle response regulator CtrA